MFRTAPNINKHQYDCIKREPVGRYLYVCRLGNTRTGNDFYCSLFRRWQCAFYRCHEPPPPFQSGSRGMIRNPAARLQMQTIDWCCANPGSRISSLFLFLLSHFALLDPNQNQIHCGSGSATQPSMQLHFQLPSNSSICSVTNT
jgi:hypothetical protein